MSKRAVMCMLLLLLASPAFGQVTFWGTPNPSSRVRVELIANLYLRDATGLVAVTMPPINNSLNARYIRAKNLALPEDWNLSEVRVSADGTRVINGYQALVVTAGIRIWDAQENAWQPLTWSCMDRAISFDPARNIIYATCNVGYFGWELQRVSPAGGSPTTIYSTEYEIVSADTNPATGGIAFVEGRYSLDIQASQRRIVLLDADGDLQGELPWEVDDTMGQIRWSPAGDELGYLRGGNLLFTDGTGYGTVSGTDVSSWTYLPEGGYAVGRIYWLSLTDPRFKRADAKTVVSVQPAEGIPSAFAVLGRIWAMDAYAR